MDQSWNLQSLFPQGQRLQLEEEYYMPGHAQDHPHQPLHTASYPPANQGRYRNYPQDPNARQQIRSQSYGNNSMNMQGFGHNTEAAYGKPVPHTQGPPFQQTPTSTNGFYSNALPYHQPYMQGSLSSSPGTSSGIPLPDFAAGNESGVTPPFMASPMSVPVTFESQAPQGQIQYKQQQFQMRSPSSSNSPGEIAHEDEYVHPPKRTRHDDEDAIGLDGMEHENSEGQESKDSKAKP
jgi:hypothetical protein